MQLDGPWVSEAGAQKVFAVLEAAGHQAYFVGGCVRNAILNVPISDIDIATDAEPLEVCELAESAGIRAVKTGLEHGTITLVIGKTPYELTTFRRDVETDGRRAVVRFSTDIVDDALRRDLTMNALYADKSGNVIDPLSGLADVSERRVRFIENPDRRIKEDYLRILRFFRFYAWYGDPCEGIDPDGLAACAANLGGLETLAKERIGAEMLKLLAAPDPAPALAAMSHSGVLGTVLAGADITYLPILIHLEEQNAIPPNPLRRLALLGGEDVLAALRLSRADANSNAALRQDLGQMRAPAELGYRLGAHTAQDVVLLRSAMFETDLPVGWIEDITRGSDAKFEIRATDLMPALQGPELGKALRELEEAWVSSGFTLTREALLARVGQT
jgi:poly(A) polymerase